MAHSGKSITFGADLLPDENNIYNLGNASQQWKIFGTLTGSATSWTSAQTVYVTLGSASTATTINGGQSNAQTIGVDGILNIANGGTGVSQFTKNQVILSDNVNGKTNLVSRAYSDSSSAGALSSSSTNFVTERDIYYGLPTINNAHNYTSGSNIFAPTTSGTQYQLLVSDGANKAPVWTVAAFLQSATSTENQTAAYSTLTLGNNAAVNSTSAHSQGILRLYSDNTTYTDIQSQLTKSGNSNSNKTFYLPQYTGTDQMYAVHAGNNNAVGSSTQPVYVAAGGRITASNGTVGDNYTPTFLNAGTTEIVFPVQYKTFTIAQGATGTTLSSPAYNSAGIDSSAIDIFVLTIVVNQNDISHLNAPIEWSTDTNNQIVLYTDVATSGSVSGYILTARGCEAPAAVSS